MLAVETWRLIFKIFDGAIAAESGVETQSCDLGDIGESTSRSLLIFVIGTSATAKSH